MDQSGANNVDFNEFRAIVGLPLSLPAEQEVPFDDQYVFHDDEEIDSAMEAVKAENNALKRALKRAKFELVDMAIARAQADAKVQEQEELLEIMQAELDAARERRPLDFSIALPLSNEEKPRASRKRRAEEPPKPWF